MDETRLGRKSVFADSGAAGEPPEGRDQSSRRSNESEIANA